MTRARSDRGWSRCGASRDDLRDSDRRGRYRSYRQSSARRRSNSGMGNYLGPRKLLRVQPNELMCDRLTTSKDIGGHSRGRDSAIGVMNLIDVGDVRDVGNVRYVPDVGDVDYAKVIAAVMIPGEVRLPRAQREPGGQADTSDADTNGKVWSSNECNHGRHIDREPQLQAP